MGKRVFEVAKELGVDHRDLLKKCDVLQIRVRNYMSMLSEEDESRLRGSFEQSGPVVEKVQAPGVVRRRRAPKRDATGPTRVTPTKGRIGLPSSRDDAQRADSGTAAPVAAPPVRSIPPQPGLPPEPRVDERQAAAEPQPVEAVPVDPEVSVTPAQAAAEPVAATDKAAESGTQNVAQSAAEEPAVAAAPVTAGGKTPAVAGTQPKARVLGSIPIDQLKARTARPPARKPANRGGHQGQGRFGNQGQRGGPSAGGWQKQDGGPTGRAAPFDPNTAPGASVPRPGMEGTRRRRAPAGGGRDDDRERGGQQRSGQGSRRRQVYSREDIYQGSSKANRGRKRKASSRKGMKTQLTTPAAHKRVVRINETISVGELGKEMGVKAAELIGKLIQMGVMATINQQVDLDTATLLATDYDYEVKNIAFDEEAFLSGPKDDEKVEDPNAELRAPVVTIMGHVDHGKTTLLDRIRAANVADGEAGGITQHVGAYKVPVGESEVVFLDTPGHEAFTAMRARGASVTDIVVLIVAADDGVMPQTIESINHAKAAGVPLVVAVNKIDKPGVDPERIKQELTTYELVPEEWGGETIYVPVSALKGEGIDDLLEALVLQAEVLELRANPKADAFGAVVEARVDKGLGTVCTVLVQEGTLKRGDYVVCGSHYGRVRAMLGDGGAQVQEAGPSTPVEVLGLAGMPAAGDSFHVVANERDARKVVSSRSDKARVAQGGTGEPLDPMALLAAFGQPEKLIQNIILKSDVSGSYEAIKASLMDLSNDEVEVKLLHGGVGAVTESDVDLAQASGAVVVGFNTDYDSKAKRAADKSEVVVLQHSIIYETIDAVKALLGGLLAPETVEELIGKVEVRAVFHIQKIGPVAGCFVLDGKVVRNSLAKVIRADEEVQAGKLTTLKRFKDDVREVGTGYECGISIEGYKGIEEGDVIEVYEVKEIQRSLD